LVEGLEETVEAVLPAREGLRPHATTQRRNGAESGLGEGPWRKTSRAARWEWAGERHREDTGCTKCNFVASWAARCDAAAIHFR